MIFLKTKNKEMIGVFAVADSSSALCHDGDLFVAFSHFQQVTEGLWGGRCVNAAGASGARAGTEGSSGCQ